MKFLFKNLLEYRPNLVRLFFKIFINTAQQIVYDLELNLNVCINDCFFL